MTQEILVLGGGPVGHALATRLFAHGRTVAFVDEDEGTLTRARSAGFDTYESSLESAATPHDLSAQTVVVATASDARNLLLAGGAPGAFGAERVIALVNDPHNQTAFEDSDIETICVSETLSRSTTVHLIGDESVHGEEDSSLADDDSTVADERPTLAADESDRDDASRSLTEETTERERVHE